MQERLLQIMQMIQYRNIQAWKTVLTTVSIGNQFGFDNLSVNALESMNFKVKSTSKKTTATIMNLVPTISYSDQLTWIKYGKSITGVLDTKNINMRSKKYTNSIIHSLCECLLSNDDNYLTMDLSHEYVSTVESFIRDKSLVGTSDNVLTRWKELMSEGGRLELNPIASWIGKMALYENAIPLSVFTHALSDKLLKNQIIFDLSLETIQQFEIVMVSCRIKFNHFEGDQSTYRLRCKRCNELLFPETDICTLLNGGPAAMLIQQVWLWVVPAPWLLPPMHRQQLPAYSLMPTATAPALLAA
jgi:hypothetical protein